jgi:transcriptional regulator with XRE-family HTH domain
MKNATLSIAEQIRQARLKAGFSQNQLAKQLDVTQVFISQLENGHKAPSVAFLISLARVTGAEFRIGGGTKF